jgi:hypothetical protein
MSNDDDMNIGTHKLSIMNHCHSWPRPASINVKFMLLYKGV